MAFRMPRSVHSAWENTRLAFETLLANRFRSFLTVLGIFIGVLLVVTVAAVLNGFRQSVVDQVEQFLKVVFLSGEEFVDLLPKEFEVVGKLQGSARKRNARLDLRTQTEIVPTQPQLTQQFTERSGLRAGLCVVSDRVQADVVIAFSQSVE